MNINTALTHEEKVTAFNEMIEIIPVIERCAEVMGCSFEDLSNLMDSPLHKPEYADYAKSMECRNTIFPERSFDNKIMFQSFEIFNIVLFRLNSDSEAAVWLELDNLPCRKEDSQIVNLMFTESWANNSEVDITLLTQLIDFKQLKYDSGIEWRRLLRAFYGNNYNLATQTVDVFTGIPKRIKSLHRQLADFALLTQKIKPTNHLQNPREPLLEEAQYARSESIARENEPAVLIRPTKE